MYAERERDLGFQENCKESEREKGEKLLRNHK
jgi:hypothetical protein